MKSLSILVALFLSSISMFSQLEIRTNLEHTEDSYPQQNVPKGELLGPFNFHSKIIKNTVRQYWLFIPAQYDASKPASVLVFQDGTNDLSNEWGDWFLANKQMISALKYANSNANKTQQKGAHYEFKNVWTDGKHKDKHAGVLLPEGLKWLFNN